MGWVINRWVCEVGVVRRGVCGVVSVCCHELGRWLGGAKGCEFGVWWWIVGCDVVKGGLLMLCKRSNHYGLQAASGHSASF